MHLTGIIKQANMDSLHSDYLQKQHITGVKGLNLLNLGQIMHQF